MVINMRKARVIRQRLIDVSSREGRRVPSQRAKGPKACRWK
jgi:hypothetical protein